MSTNTAPVRAQDELRMQAALLRTPEFMAQFDPEKFAGQLERIAAALAQQPAAVDEAAAIRAFEEHFEASAEDPYFEGELELWLTAWRKALAAQQPAAPSAEPAVWVAADTLNSPHPTCVSSLAYVSQLDKDRGREYVPLYCEDLDGIIDTAIRRTSGGDHG